MRGRMAGGRGRVAGTQPQNEATANVYSLPAPYKGWNAIGNLANMDPLQAIQMDNIFPSVADVQLRKGYINWVTGAPATIHSLLAYSGPTLNKLFAATSTGIYDVTGSGTFGAAVVTCTGGYWKGLNIANSGGNFLFAVNGADSAKLFDGTTWTIPSITGATTSNWNYIALHKRRIWAVEQNSMNLWYLATDAIAGAATQFPVGGLFKRGGHIIAIGTYTIQYYSGPDDYFVILTSNGEIAVYQGTDPSTASTWALVATYDLGLPTGDAPLYRFGADLLYMSQTGLLPFSRVRESIQQDSVLNTTSAISYNIQGAFLDAVAAYSANKGWQVIAHKAADLLIVNIPVSQDTVSYQFVMNTTTKAWCRFTGWNASCWATLGGDLFFAGGTNVCKAWTGVTDNGAPIIGTCLQAYSSLGNKGQKTISLVRPNIGIAGSAQIILALDNDFKTFGGQTMFGYAPLTSGAVWDVSDWDAGIWDSGTSVYEPVWTTVPNNPGYLHSMRIQITSSTGSFLWTSTNYAFKQAGIL